MALKVKASSIFRKNTPGERLGSIRGMAKYRGQLYSFQYTSWGKYKKGVQRLNLDRYPVLLLAYKDGAKTWKAKNNKTYIYGFNINYLAPHKRLQTVRYVNERLSDDVFYSYESLKELLALPSAKGNTIFRKYDVRGGKLRYLKQVDLDKYVEYLHNSIDMDEDADDVDERD